MKIIKDGDCYNQVLYTQTSDGKTISYNTLMQPTESVVLDVLQLKFTALQYVNWFLMKTDKGFILEFGDHVEVMHAFETTYLDFVEWVRDEYLNKMFSWQQE